MSEGLEAAQHGTQVLLGLGTTLVVVAGALVTLRVTMDVKSSGKLNADDYLSIAAIVLLAATLGIFYEFLKAYIGGTASPFYTSQLIVAQALVSGFATWFAKAPILVLYLRLFGIRIWVRYICWFMLGATAIAYFIAITYNAAGCFPESQSVDFQFVIDCTHLSSITGVSLGGIAVATDTIIFLIPLPIILHLHLSIQKKIGLALVFFTGSLGTIASAVALSYKVQSLSGSSTDVSTAVILTIVELSIAIGVGCAPAIRSFWVGIVQETVVYSKLTSWASQVSFGLKTRGSATRGSARETTEGPSEFGGVYDGSNGHPYNVLDKRSPRSADGQAKSGVPLVALDQRV